jgi:hypothetical protein
MFGLGLALGVLLAGFVGWRAVEAYRRGPLLPYRPQQTIRDIERRTLHELLSAEFSAERAATADDRPQGPPS